MYEDMSTEEIFYTMTDEELFDLLTDYYADEEAAETGWGF